MDDKTVTQDLYKFWEKEDLFKADPDSQKPHYSLLMPPPNLTGELHLGHAMQHSILDALARFKRLQGFDVLLLPGVDHAGIQFEGTFNKILAKEDLSKQKLGRDEWLKKAWEFRDEIYKSFHDTWTVMGVSADWSREVFTMEPKVQKAVFFEFKTLWEQRLLYKGAYIVQWCPRCSTAIEDLEMEYLDKKEKLYFVKYKIADATVILSEAKNPKLDPSPDGHRDQDDKESEYITVATARPETIYADTGIAVYQKHPKFSKFVGKMAVNPLNGNKIPVFEDKRVEKDFGTGALKITPGHDPLDFEIGQEHKLPILHAIDKTGRMTALAQDLEGLKVEEARAKVVEKLGSAIDHIEDYTHSVPVCERCKGMIEPLISEEWFVKMKGLAGKALKNLDKINFLPKNYHKIIADWYKEIHDWSISRSLWWGHRIPVWYCEKCNPGHKVGKEEDMAVSFDKPTQTCKICKSNAWVQDEQVLDTWFSSGLWPFSTLGWPEKSKEFEKYFPWDFEISAPEIKYLWIARMIMLSLHFTDQIPFKNMFFHGMLRDLSGKKFSKSLGNGINPNDLREAWGTDAIRMALYSYSAPGRDGKTSRQIMDERCKNFRNFGTKIKNLYRFIYELKPEDLKEGMTQNGAPHRLPATSLRVRTSDGAVERQDPEIIGELNKTIKEITKYLESFQLHLATETLYDFIWHKFADVYIEKSKERRLEAQPTLEYVFETCLKLLHPFMPFLTEELYQKLPERKKSIMLEEWPRNRS